MIRFKHAMFPFMEKHRLFDEYGEQINSSEFDFGSDTVDFLGEVITPFTSNAFSRRTNAFLNYDRQNCAAIV
jgi:hypothetical protein